MAEDDSITFDVKFTIKKRWVPVFLAFLNKLFQNSMLGRSSMVGFYADGEEDFKFKASIGDEGLENIKKEYGMVNWDGKTIVDTERAYAKPVAKNVFIPGFYCHEIEEVYDAN